MENKIHDDQLDDYVRRSFEGYEEEPSPGMWGRIEGDLQPAAPAVPRLSFRRYRWQAAAAAVVLLLLCGLVCEHFYYEKKIRDLAAEGSEAQELTGEKPAASGDVFVEKNVPQNTQQQVGSSPFFEKKSEPTTSGNQNIETPLGSQEVTQSHSLNWSANSVVPTPETVATQNQSTPENPNSTPSVLNQELNAEQLVRENPTANETTTTFAKPTDFAPLATQIFPVKTKNPAHPVFAIVLIEPLREPSGWYVGLQSTPHVTLEKAKPPRVRPGERPVFVSQQESSDISADWWLKVGRKLNSRLSLESGIGYSAASRTATHTARFRFGDGTTGGAPHRRNFSYDLNTYGGSAAVSLRMEQVDSAPVPDDEPVSLRVRTSERTQLLRVPLLAAYRLGTGRLRGIVKTGLTGNFFLKNELDIAARVSQNSRFQPVQGSGSYTVQLNQPGKFFLGYWLSAGAGFQLTRHIGLVAEPSFSGDFPRSDAAGRRLPGHFSLGLNVGANYYF